MYLKVLNIKNCRSKLSIEMFIKRKNRSGKTYAFEMVLNFKTLVAYKKSLTSRRITASFVKQFSSDIT